MNQFEEIRSIRAIGDIPRRGVLQRLTGRFTTSGTSLGM